MALQLNGKAALYAFIVLLLLANLFGWVKDAVGFGQGQLDRELNSLRAANVDHDARLRGLEDRFARIETKLDFLIEKSKEAK